MSSCVASWGRVPLLKLDPTYLVLLHRKHLPLSSRRNAGWKRSRGSHRPAVVGGRERSFSASEEVLMRRYPSVGQCGHLSLARARTNRPRFTAAQWGGESVTSAKLRLFYFPSTQDPGRRDCIFILIFFQDQLKMYWSYWSNCCGVGSVIISKSCSWWMMLI